MTRRRGHNEGTIYERRDKDGRVFGYQSQLTVPGGKRRSFSGKTKRDVQQKLNEARSALLQGRLTASRGQILKVYLDGWLGTVRHSIKPRTYEVYALNVRRIGAYLGHIRLDMLAPAHVQDCYNALLVDGLAPRTVHQAHMVLHKALADAIRVDLVARNVTEGVSVPRPDHKEMETLSSEQLSLLFGATRSDRFGALWMLLGTTGLRITPRQSLVSV